MRNSIPGTRIVLLSCFLAIAMLLCLPWTAQANKAGFKDLYAFLEQKIGFSQADIRSLEGGEARVRSLDTDLRRELALFGIVWVDVPPSFYIEQFKDIEAMMKSSVLQVGKISEPPVPEDFRGLSFHPDEFKRLKNCKVGDCKMKLSIEAINRIRDQIDWSAGDSKAQADRLLRKMAQEFVTEYKAEGNKVLLEYRDKKVPISVLEELKGLSANSPFLEAFYPKLHTFLQTYPDKRPPRTDDFMYWFQAEFGLKPTIFINHVVIYYEDLPEVQDIVIASKQIYASHYFNSAFDFSFLISDPKNPDPKGFYFVTLKRSRSDGMEGTFGGMIRSRALKKALEGLEEFIPTMKKETEAAYGAQK